MFVRSYVRFMESRKTGQQHIFIFVLNLYINITGNLIITVPLLWALYSVSSCIGDHLNYKTVNLFENLDVMKPPKLRAHRSCKEYQNAETRDDSCQFLIRPQNIGGRYCKSSGAKNRVLWAQLWSYLLGIWPPAGITITFVIRLSGGAAHNCKGIDSHTLETTDRRYYTGRRCTTFNNSSGYIDWDLSTDVDPYEHLLW